MGQQKFGCKIEFYFAQCFKPLIKISFSLFITPCFSKQPIIKPFVAELLNVLLHSAKV